MSESMSSPSYKSVFWTYWQVLWLSTVLQVARVASYSIVRDYSGPAFFDRWDFYGGYDNLTLGDVVWVDRDTAFRQGLVYTNGAGNAVLRVDNATNVPFNYKRNSIRITTQDAYSVGSLWIADLVHMPFGCSVWPAFWTKGPTWPDDGEIDILEGINRMTNNQMSLHTTPGCTRATLLPPDSEIGTVGAADCSQLAGCIVSESQPGSFGAAFNVAGGGVYAAQFDVSGIFIWFWSRPNVPQSVLQSTPTSSIDISQWGPPSASFPATTCDINRFFRPQNLILDITLCGAWAGLPSEYLSTCGNTGPSGICYIDNVVGSGNRYDEAYFEIKHVRAYTTGVPAPPVGGGRYVSSGWCVTRPRRRTWVGFVMVGALIALGVWW